MGFKERNGMIFGLQATKCWDIITDKHGYIIHDENDSVGGVTNNKNRGHIEDVTWI